MPPRSVEEALPPWELTAECWLFPFWTSDQDKSTSKRRAALAAESSPEVTNRASAAIRAALKLGLPGGAFHPLETLDESVTDDELSAFSGKLGAWILYRYTDAPVGPYDELIYVAGFFKTPGSKSLAPRITNIYVSSTASVWNGRRNWNIPKHVADFDWSADPHSAGSAEQTVTVSHPASSPLTSSYREGRPFFSASLQPSRLPGLPVNTGLSIFPGIPLPQPPLHACEAYTDGELADVQVGTESNIFRSTSPTFKGSFGFAYAKPLLGGPSKTKLAAYGDGVSFPMAENTWSIGVRFRRVIVTFPKPVEVKV